MLPPRLCRETAALDPAAVRPNFNWALLLGTYGNWIVTTSAAVLGTAALSPITAMGHEAAPWKEAMITGGFVFIGLAIILAVILLMLGLRGTAKPE